MVSWSLAPLPAVWWMLLQYELVLLPPSLGWWASRAGLTSSCISVSDAGEGIESNPPGLDVIWSLARKQWKVLSLLSLSEPGLRWPQALLRTLMVGGLRQQSVHRLQYCCLLLFLVSPGGSMGKSQAWTSSLSPLAPINNIKGDRFLLLFVSS